ncbi:MAG TPA: hypothetical protein VI032_12835 [Burkholderiaceae bacterium]
MPNALSAWSYAPSVPPPRQAALASPSSFDDLVALAVADISNVRARVASGRDPGLEHCLQPVFSFELQNTGDRLFNGPYGYRAEYRHSPSRGLAANAALLIALTPKLLAAVDATLEPRFCKLDPCVSLRAVSAKFWVQEIPSVLVSPTEDLHVQPWLAEAQRGVQLARWGVCAPEVTRFDIKGALLDAHGNEVVPSRKVARHYDIHNYGFS